MNHNFSENLRYYRKLNNMTQEQLVEKLNKTRQSITNYETGARKCSIEFLINVAELFDVTVEELLFNNTNNRTND